VPVNDAVAVAALIALPLLWLGGGLLLWRPLKRRQREGRAGGALAWLALAWLLAGIMFVFAGGALVLHRLATAWPAA
jgi:hypothetical protein